jgi:hypothetical protein
MPLKKNELPTKDKIISHMRTGIVNFTFKKKDGELREMNGTLVENQIPEFRAKETSANPHDADPDLVVCWDTDKTAWRSFKISSLEEYNGRVQLL